MRDNGETCFNVVVLKPSGEVGDSKDRHILTHNVFEGVDTNTSRKRHKDAEIHYTARLADM